jgi:hypothetical protein
LIGQPIERLIHAGKKGKIEHKTWEKF